MNNTPPTTLRGWIEEAQKEGYALAEKWLLLSDYELGQFCASKEDCESYIRASLDEDWQFGWRHYRPDRVPKTDVYWIIRMGDDPTKAVLSEYGGAYDPISGIDFDPGTIRFFHELTAPGWRYDYENLGNT